MEIKPHANRPVLNPCTLEGRNYQVDPYIGCGHYCYYCYVLNQAETDWTKEVWYHENLAGRLEEAISGIQPQSIYMGWLTDPYQPCEKEYCQTRQVLELLQSKGFSPGILTKSDLILRDMDLLQKMDQASVSVSVAFKDNAVRQLFEADTMDTELRIEALRKFKAAGIRTAALLCPVIPYITEVRRLIDMLAPHTTKIWIYGLSILDPTEVNWQHVKRILKTHFPDLKDQVEAAVFSKEHLYWLALRKDLEEMAKERKLDLSIHV